MMSSIKHYFLCILIASSFLMSDFNYTLSIKKDAARVSFENIRTQAFTPLARDYINKGLSKKKYWLKVSIFSNTDESLVIDIQDPTINKLKFYDEFRMLYHTGDLLPFESRERKEPTFAFKIDIPKNKTSEYYIYFEDVTMMTFPITILPLSSFQKAQNDIKAFYFIFFGFMLALILYNLFLYFILRDKAYLYYIFLELCLVLFLTAMSGIGSYMLWTDCLLLNNIIYAYLDDIGLIFLLLFVITFLETKKHFYTLYKIAIFLIMMIIIVLFTTGLIHAILVKPVMISSILFAYYIVYCSFRLKIPYSKYIILGITLLTVSSLSMLFRNFGWMEVNFFTSYSLYISTMLESILFSIALAKKIEYLQSQRREALETSATLLDNVQQKELLLKEVRHRMKNNLQVISSFIGIAQIKNKSTPEIFNSLQDRLKAITNLHEAFEMQKGKEDTIDIQYYLNNLIQDIQLAYDKSKDITIDTNIDTLTLPFEKAMLIGLVVNELFTNAFKYAFVNIKSPVITLSFIKNEENYILKINDNGIGFDKNSVNDGLGNILIDRIITRQLKGTYTIESSNKGSFYSIFL